MGIYIIYNIIYIIQYIIYQITSNISTTNTDSNINNNTSSSKNKKEKGKTKSKTTSITTNESNNNTTTAGNNNSNINFEPMTLELDWMTTGLVSIYIFIYVTQIKFTIYAMNFYIQISSIQIIFTTAITRAFPDGNIIYIY